MSDADDVFERAKRLREQVADRAEELAATEDKVSATFEHLAESGGPREAERRETAAKAREAAEKERARAARYRAED